MNVLKPVGDMQNPNPKKDRKFEISSWVEPNDTLPEINSEFTPANWWQRETILSFWGKRPKKFDVPKQGRRGRRKF